MGLDMYIARKKRDDAQWQDHLYWRKANAIRAFFVRECGKPGDEEEHFIGNVKRFTFQKLRGICEKLLSSAKHVSYDSKLGWVMKDDWTEKSGYDQPEAFKNLAAELLPSQSGFFFGSTDYDYWYVQDLCTTANYMKKLLDGWTRLSPTYDDNGFRYRYEESW